MMATPTVAAFAMPADVLTAVFPPELMNRLRQTVHIRPGPPLTDLTATGEDLSGIQILITGWGCPRIDIQALTAMPRLRAIVHAAGSVKGHVGEAVFQQDIIVSSAAAANAIPVADFTIAACVLSAKRAFRHARSYMDRPLDTSGYGLHGATVGVIGASRIGRLVIAALHQHHARILVADPYLTATEAQSMNAELADVDTLCRASDIITLHAPELPETRHLIDGQRLSMMRPGAVLINTGRGSLIDTDALAAHCAQGSIDAVLDVTEPEPLPAWHPLLGLPNVFLTPHIAGALGKEVPLLGAFAVGEIERLLAGQPLHGEIRAAELARLA